MKTACFLLLSSFALTFLSLTSPAPAIELVLTPIADSTVDAINPDATNSNGQLLAAAVGDFGQPATTLSFVYTQFMLPDGMTGQDIGSINSLDLQFSRANPNVTLALNYYAYGVFDGFDFGSADDYTWNDGIGFFPDNTEIRAFADADEISYYSDPAESSFIATLRSEPEGDPTLPFGLAAAQTATARANFQNLILNDTDGKITIFTKVRQNFAVTPLQPFESIEDVNPFTLAPMLIIDYSEEVPGDYNGDRIVNAADYTVWRDTLGSATDLAADGNGNLLIDAGDYEVWVENFGTSRAAGGSGSLAPISIPEPTSLALAALMLLWPLPHAGRGNRTRFGA